MRILVVEDDAVLVDVLQHALRRAGYVVDACRDGVAADAALADPAYDLVILDLGLPRRDGFEVLRALRQRKPVPPVLVLTARDALADRVRGLDLGADDYMVKPFDLPELEARIRALVRRTHAAAPEIALGPLRFDLAARRMTLDGADLELSQREYALLETLLLRAGQVVGKDQLVDKLCSRDEAVGTNAIEVYIHRLRKKIEPAGIRIKTVRGMGYLLEKPGE